MSKSRPNPKWLYLIHLSQPLGTAQHYLGSTPETDLSIRIGEHRASVWLPFSDGQKRPSTKTGQPALGTQTGNGARLLAVANFREIAWKVVRVWPQPDRHLESAIKASHRSMRWLCPVCNQELSQQITELINIEDESVPVISAPAIVQQQQQQQRQQQQQVLQCQ